MNRYIKKAFILFSTVIMMSSNITTVYADEVKDDIEESLGIEVLYAISEENYKDALDKNAIIIHNSNNFLIIGENISGKDAEIMESAESLYFFGEYNEAMERFTSDDNYKGNLFGYNMYESGLVAAMEQGADRDIIVVNGASKADTLTAAQLGLDENKVVMIIEEEGIPRFTGEYIAEFGKGKSIAFVEGELKIDSKKRNQILSIAANGDARYELDKKKITLEVDDKKTEELVEDTVIEEKELNVFDRSNKIIGVRKEEDNFTFKILQVSAINFMEKTTSQQEVLDAVKEHNVIETFEEERDNIVMTANWDIEEVDEEQSLTITRANIYKGNDGDTDLEVITVTRPKPKPKRQQMGEISSISQRFIDQLVTYEGWDYSQGRRHEWGFADCSSIVERAMRDSGITDYSNNLVVSTILTDRRFQEIAWEDMLPGDILVTVGHTEVYMGGDTTFGAFQPGRPAGYGKNIYRFDRVFRLTGL